MFSTGGFSCLEHLNAIGRALSARGNNPWLHAIQRKRLRRYGRVTLLPRTNTRLAWHHSREPAKDCSDGVNAPVSAQLHMRLCPLTFPDFLCWAVPRTKYCTTGEWQSARLPCSCFAPIHNTWILCWGMIWIYQHPAQRTHVGALFVPHEHNITWACYNSPGTIVNF